MKKLVVMVLLAAFAVGCTATSVEEENYDNEIQLIDKDEVMEPDDRSKKEVQAIDKDEALSPDDIRDKANSENE